MDEAFRILDDGRVYFDYGPASMVVTARRGDEDLSDLAASAFPLLRDSLSEIAGALPVLRRFPDGMDYSDLTGLPRVMAESVLATGEPTLTPMAAVAGTVADAVADWLFARGADLVAVNNGGDVALRLGEGRSIRMGILPDLNGRVAQVVEIRAEDGIGGVCTSGLGGRSLTRGIAGNPGEIKGYFSSGKCGTLIGNTDNGVYGIFTQLPAEPPESALPVATRSEVRAGSAYIWCTLDTNQPCRYSVELSCIDTNSTSNKCFTVTVTDPALLEKTGGIIQGMSGSPIIQDGKIVGAVTHVLINDPSRGYGIFVENMLDSMPDLLR